MDNEFRSDRKMMSAIWRGPSNATACARSCCLGSLCYRLVRLHAHQSSRGYSEELGTAHT